MQFKYKYFNELSVSELYEIVRARTEIFLLEQKIICQDFDGEDYNALHCFIEDNGKVVAYLRAYKIDKNTVKIGRVLTITHGIGLGKELMNKSMPIILEKFNGLKITLNAQSYAKGFYEKCGFKVVSNEFLEENIPHLKMEYC
ncbi:MAG: GNAT family N-acetyltransferase [Clostridia bacterium]|nr:GNAT family N-acetyltransferase [Clostridia bacterium]